MHVQVAFLEGLEVCEPCAVLVVRKSRIGAVSVPRVEGVVPHDLR